MEVLNEREKTHGDFAKVARTANEIRELITGNEDSYTAVQGEALTMIATKLARIACSLEVVQRRE